MQRDATSLDFTINSGQVFLWDRTGNTWYGIDGQELLVVREPFEIISDKGYAGRFFRLDDDMPSILAKIGRDPLVGRAARKFKGLRLARQDPFQCYISFICSSNSSIQNIRSMLKKLCAKFGGREEHEGRLFSTFPSPERLARATAPQLLSCGLGFRARYVREASKAVASGKLDLEALRSSDYAPSLDALKGITGIGNKVADCILLFSLDKLESFPIDRWTLRILQKYYPKVLHGISGKSLTEKKYGMLHENIVKYFGPYAGYSQQFLFKWEREMNKKKW